MDFFCNFPKNYKNVIANLQYKLAKFQNLTTKDFLPFKISNAHLSIFEKKYKSKVIEVARKIGLFYLMTLPLVVTRVRFIYNNSQSLPKCFKTIGLFSFSSLWFIFYQNKKLSHFIKKEIKKIAFFDYLTQKKLRISGEEFIKAKKLFSHQIQYTLNSFEFKQ